MINTMKQYDFYNYTTADSYGQPQLEKGGSVKMGIYLTTQAIQQNINYQSATYLGLTHSKLDSSFVIQYGDKKLKVLYVNNSGRINQVFMEEM